MVPDRPLSPKEKSLTRCSNCGHVHDPEDGRCDHHAEEGVGRCPCPVRPDGDWLPNNAAIGHEVVDAALCDWWQLRQRFRSLRFAWRLASAEANRLTKRAEVRRADDV